MPERRYTEDEVAAIFARATEVQQPAQRQLITGEGMSLAELQAIGQEAGIAPELVAAAARALDQPAPPKVPTFLGIPLGAAHTVELGRRLSDDEWERFVVQLRETFDARGRLSTEGSFRQWTNGNLQVLVEPSGDGHRVRFRTRKDEARIFMTIGVGIVGASVAVFVASLLVPATPLADAISKIWSTALIGVGFFAAGSIRLPWWARRRRAQMERLGAKLLSGG
jgi:hypothetical protein